MLIIPAIDLKDGHCVRLKQGVMDDATVFSEDPGAMAQHWLDQGARRLHLVDLNGAFAGKPKNEEAIKAIVAAVGDTLPVQLGGGIRDLKAIEDWLDRGIRRVILGTVALRDPELALRAAGTAIPDWSGGTRLGESLRAFLDLWGQRGTARRAVVVLASDGWERGDAALLGEQMARLARLAHAVVWVNPHRGKEGFAPVTTGMRAALPHVDDLVAGHTLAALHELAEVIARA